MSSVELRIACVLQAVIAAGVAWALWDSRPWVARGLAGWAGVAVLLAVYLTLEMRSWARDEER